MSRFVPDATWVVPPDEADDYRDAPSLLTVAGLSEARNLALDDAGDDLCVQIDDDLRSLEWLDVVTGEVSKLTVRKAVIEIAQRMDWLQVRLGGTSTTGNPYFTRRRVTMRGFVMASFMVAAPSPIRFDPRLALKEDYDYSIRHIVMYGGVARVDSILPRFRHRTNTGGAVDVRTDELEQATIRELRERWGPMIAKGRNRNEIKLDGRYL